MNTKRFFNVNTEEKIWWKIILWWEIRRIPYNIFLILILIVTFGLLALLPNDGFIIFLPGPMLVVGTYFIILLYFLFANVFYSSGWLFQLITREVNSNKIKVFTKKLFLIGLLFSILVTLIPILLGLMNISLGFLDLSE